MANLWEKIQEFESKSMSGKFYTVSRNCNTGELGCTCPGWIYRKDKRICVHTLTVENQELRDGSARQSTNKSSTKNTHINTHPSLRKMLI